MLYLLTLLACGDGEAPPPPSATSPAPAGEPPAPSATPPPAEAPPSPPAPAGEAPDKPAPKPPGPEPTTPGARCVHSAPAAADGWRKATPEDIIPDLREHTKCQAISGDFDSNGTSDTAVLEVHSDRRQSRLRIILSNGTEMIARDWPMVPESLGGLAPTIFNPRSAAEDIARDNISDEAREGLKERDAIEVCYGGDEGTPLSEQDASDLCYCSEFWLVDKGEAVKHLVCD